MCESRCTSVKEKRIKFLERGCESENRGCWSSGDWSFKSIAVRKEGQKHALDKES